MLFDIRPKEERKDLYDRDKEIDEIRQSIERGVWIAVYGIRRVGKTSVVNVAVNDPNYIVIKINLMRMYNPRRKVYARSQFMGVFLEGINNAIKKYTLGGRAIRYISNILGTDEKSSIELNAVRIKTRLKKFREEDVSSVVREIDQLAKDNRKKLVLVFDEAQELMRVNGINSSSVFHDIYDYCKSTTVVFTGSMVGLVEKMLKELEYQKPFFGRYIRKIRVERFELNRSKDFLMRGFEEEGIKVGEDILVEAVRRFDGVQGG
ncbi:AAA family ATPase [Metallosphaera hakonensis]|uniref:AAA family ATPase n=1 Tax=Metallosphaera hakonensis TaxID=79601 RepID=UPI0006D2A377|nr:ATP-binding protein [Metallosphaera hakonensis]